VKYDYKIFIHAFAAISLEETKHKKTNSDVRNKIV